MSVYYAITNKKDGLQTSYMKSGLFNGKNDTYFPGNVFIDDPDCEPYCNYPWKEGYIITDLKHVFDTEFYRDYAYPKGDEYLMAVTLPTDDPSFRIISDGNRFWINKYIPGRMYDLYHVGTIAMMVDGGVNKEHILVKSAQDGKIEAVKYLIENGADIHYNNDEALQISVKWNHIGVVKYLVENGADIWKITDDDLKKNNNEYIVLYLRMKRLERM